MNPESRLPMRLQAAPTLIARLRLAIERDVWPSGDWDTIDGGNSRREVALGPRHDGRTTALLILAELERRLTAGNG